MIGTFPVGLLIPGLLFMSAGFIYYSRAAAMEENAEIDRRLIKANRKSGHVALIFGVIVMIAAIPLGIAVQGVVQ